MIYDIFSTPIQLRIQPIMDAVPMIIGRPDASAFAMRWSRSAGIRAGSGCKRFLNSSQSFAVFSVKSIKWGMQLLCFQSLEMTPSPPRKMRYSSVSSSTSSSNGGKRLMFTPTPVHMGTAPKNSCSLMSAGRPSFSHLSRVSGHPVQWMTGIRSNCP